MRLDTFFEKFELFADAPSAVERMRELVMQLAVQGKLVDQKRNDGNAAQLLAAISIERDVRAEKMRTPNDPTSSEDNEHAFPIPLNWMWTQLGKIALQIQYGYTASADPSVTEVRMLRITDIQNNRVDWVSVPGCQIEPNEAEKYLLSQNDILIARTGGTIGKSFIVPDAPVKSVFASYLIRVTPPRAMVARYLKIFLESPLYWSQLRQMSAGTGQPNVNGRALGRLEIPLPPLAEQKRIVAKVDELMALCDRLEAQQAERAERHATLARAALARFAEAPTPANLTWLFHDAFPIPPADLRKAILTLAVQGKLIPQDSNDEPACVLLSQIAAHKATLAKAGKLRGATVVTAIANDGAEFEIPSNWSWVRFGEIMINRDGDRIPVSKEERETKAKTYDYYGASGIIDKIDGYLFDKPLLLIGEDGANLINRSTPIAFIARGKYWVNNHAHVLDGISENFLQFIELHINAINLEEYVTGSAQPKMNQAKMNSIPIALPPLSEQRRIVARVNQLMALVDQLETQLSASHTAAGKLLEAVVAELTSAKPADRSIQAEVIEFRSSPEFIRTVLAAEIADRIGRDDTFGQTKLQKILHLTEYIFELPEIDSHPARFARGPHDAKLIGQVETKMKQLTWFKETMRPDGHGHQYLRLANAGDQKTAFEKIWAQKTTAIRHFIDQMKTWKTERCERFATLYAAWNDLIIWNAPVSDDAVLREVLENWNSEKVKISKSSWQEMLAWMRREKFIPGGFGRATQSAPQKELF